MPNVPPQKPRNFLVEYMAQILAAIVATIIGGVILAIIIQDARFAPQPVTPTAAFVQVATNTSTDERILSGTQQMEATEDGLTQAVETQAAINLTATENDVNSANAIGTAVQIAITETADHATLMAPSATPTPQPTVPTHYVGTLPANALLVLQGEPNTNVTFEFEIHSPVELNYQSPFPADNALGRQALEQYQLSGQGHVMNGRAVCITYGAFHFAAMEGQRILLRCSTDEDGKLVLTLDDNLLWNNKGEHSFTSNVPLSIVAIAVPASEADLNTLLNELLVNVDPTPLAAAP